MGRYDVNISMYSYLAFSTHGYIIKGKGYVQYYTHRSWGQDYGKAWHMKYDSSYGIYKPVFDVVYFEKSKDRQFWQSNRYYFGSRYRHRKGSKYQVRTSTFISHKNGISYLKPGDWVAINQGQGYSSKFGGSSFRCDGYYRKGKWHELSGGYVFMPTRRVNRANRYRLKMWGMN